MEDDYNSNASTLPDYQNFRNVLFQQWEVLNNSVVELRTCFKSEYKEYLRAVIRAYLRFYSQINDKSKLGLLTKEERLYLFRYYNCPELINTKIAKNLLDITRKLMTEYGIFDLENGGDNEIW